MLSGGETKKTVRDKYVKAQEYDVSQDFAYWATKKMGWIKRMPNSILRVTRMGLEPMTPTLKVLCSTNWASESKLTKTMWKASAKVQFFLLTAK